VLPLQPLTAGPHQFDLMGATQQVHFTATVDAPAPLAQAPYAAARQGQGWRIDWRTPGGGEQTTLDPRPLGARRMSYAHAGMDAAGPSLALPGPAKFDFWSSMGELVRLVLRSRAQGLRTRLAFALGLVLIGKWTGRLCPRADRQAIDAAGKGRGTPETLFAVFMGLAARLGAAALSSPTRRR